MDVVEALLPDSADQLLEVGEGDQDGVVALVLVVVLLGVEDLLARQREVLEELVDVLHLALRALEEPHDEVCPVPIGERQGLAQVRGELARLAGQHAALVGLIDAADDQLELILELVLPADRRRVAFDDALERHDQVVVGLVLHRQGGELEVLVLGGVGELVDEGDALHVDAHRLERLFLSAVLALAGLDQAELLGLGMVEARDRAAEELQVGLVDVQVVGDEAELRVAALVALGLLLGQVLLELGLEEVEQLLLGVGADGDVLGELEAAQPDNVFLVARGLLLVVVLLGLLLVLRQGREAGSQKCGGGDQGEEGAGHDAFLNVH